MAKQMTKAQIERRIIKLQKQVSLAFTEQAAQAIRMEIKRLRQALAAAASARQMAPKFKCVSSSNEVRYFATYEEAYRFVMREGDKSRLWSLETAEDARPWWKTEAQDEQERLA